jgi:hypothetical protein
LGAIIGISVGALALLLSIVVVLLCVYLRSRSVPSRDLDDRDRGTVLYSLKEGYVPPTDADSSFRRACDRRAMCVC